MKFIDPRGSFCEPGIFGDLRYDIAKLYHSVYGKYENGVYDQIFHFIVKSSADVKESEEKIDSQFLNAHAKALNKAFEQSRGIRDSSGLRFNNYIRKNEKGNSSSGSFANGPRGGSAGRQEGTFTCHNSL